MRQVGHAEEEESEGGTSDELFGERSGLSLSELVGAVDL